MSEPLKSFQEIMAELRQFETTEFRSDPEAQEALLQKSYDALVATLAKLSAIEAVILFRVT